jgi:hypothetical protein
VENRPPTSSSREILILRKLRFAGDSPLEEAVTSEPVSGKRPENSLPGGKNKTLGSRSNSPENGTPSGGGGPPTMAFYSRL